MKAVDRRRRFRYRLFATMFIIGTVMMIAPLLYSAQIRQRNLREYREYLKHPQVPSPLREALRYNADIFAHQQGRALPYHQSLQGVITKPNQILGFVSVPAIHLLPTPIYFLPTDQHLAKGTATMAKTSLPVGGKNTMAVVTGHSGLANRVIFDNIRYLKKGDIFYFTALGQKQIAYQVDQKKVVDPDSRAALQAIRIQPGKDKAILLTCTPLFINTHRLLIYGHRIPLLKAKTHLTLPRDTFSPMHLWLMALGLLMIIFITWFVITEWRQHQARLKKG